MQVSGREKQLSCGSYSNAAEAKATVALVRMLRDCSMRQKPHLNQASWHVQEKIRIITFYQGQVTLLQSMLRQAGLGQVLVATVDSSQGCEADVVIVSFVRSNNHHGRVKRAAGFLTDDRRLNVALTRARFQLICIGDAQGTLSLSGAVTLKAVVDDAKTRKCVISLTVDNCTESPRNKKEQLALHKRVATSDIATIDDKKQSMRIVKLLLEEISDTKKRRLDEFEKIAM